MTPQTKPYQLDKTVSSCLLVPGRKWICMDLSPCYLFSSVYCDYKKQLTR